MYRTKGAFALESLIGSERGEKARAARELGISEPVLLDWITGRKRPRQHNREAIKVWSHGQITPDMWVTKDEAAKVAGVQPRKPAESEPDDEPAPESDRKPRAKGEPPVKAAAS